LGRTYWRSSATTAAALPALTAGKVDDATFRLLADNMPTLCWVANGDGYIVWYNRLWHDYCGTTPAEMEGWGWTAVHDPELLPSVMERWTASIATGQSFEMVFPLLGADGVFRPFLTRIQPVRDSTGQIARWFGVNTEIVDQIAAEEALRIERDRTREVLERMGEGFVLLGRDFRVLDINAEGMRMERRPRSEIIGHLHWEVWPGTEHSDLGRLYKGAMADGRPAFLEHQYTWPDGRKACIDVRAYPTPHGLAIFYRDVTERKRAEALLREAGARTEALAAQQTAILGQLAEGVIVTDASGRITFINEAAARIHGVARLDVEPDAYAATYHLLTMDREPYPSEQLPLARAVRGETVLDQCWRIVRPDGVEVLAVGSARPVLDASGAKSARC
jgi:PAS domain S-box-containing protein